MILIMTNGTYPSLILILFCYYIRMEDIALVIQSNLSYVT